MSGFTLEMDGWQNCVTLTGENAIANATVSFMSGMPSAMPITEHVPTLNESSVGSRKGKYCTERTS